MNAAPPPSSSTLFAATRMPAPRSLLDAPRQPRDPHKAHAVVWQNRRAASGSFSTMRRLLALATTAP